MSKRKQRVTISQNVEIASFYKDRFMSPVVQYGSPANDHNVGMKS